MIHLALGMKGIVCWPLSHYYDSTVIKSDIVILLIDLKVNSNKSPMKLRTKILCNTTIIMS